MAEHAETETINTKQLALIGDRRTCAYVANTGSIVWYCPRRFDAPAVLAGLLDLEKGGSWQIRVPGAVFESRDYRDDSALLCTRLRCDNTVLEIEDYMPMGATFQGICRSLTEAPEDLQVMLSPKTDFGLSSPTLAHIENNSVSIANDLYYYASHPLTVVQGNIVCEVPAGQKSWFVLSEQQVEINQELLVAAFESTKKEWREVTVHIHYEGPYQAEIRHSLRVLRLMTFAENGGIIAAGTAALPEVAGGARNYDYRYVWLRDAAMIASALTRAGSDGKEERRFLSFICDAMHGIDEPIVPFFTLDKKPAPGERLLRHLKGYGGSLPIRIGNNAKDQLQLDAISNVLLAAKLIYNRFDTREHWGLVSTLADYLAMHWQEPDHGIWEETQKLHYTSSKVVAAVSLEFIADHSQEQEQCQRWKKAAANIRAYVAQNCLTSEGAYAAYAGAEAVDVSAILFPIWAYTDADAAPVLKTIEVLERDYCENNLFRRHLVDFDSSKEGAFLAGSLWVAQYWVMRRDWTKFKEVLEAVLQFQNDVGLMPEEGDPVTGAYLGNIPQTFVHASLIGAIIDYKTAMDEESAS